MKFLTLMSGAPVKNGMDKTTGVVLVFRDQTKERQVKGKVIKKNKIKLLLFFLGLIRMDALFIRIPLFNRVGNKSVFRLDLLVKGNGKTYIQENESIIGGKYFRS